MKSNIQLLKEELARRKQGNVQQTINNLVIVFGRNRKNLKESFELLGQSGIIQVDETGIWKYIDQDCL